MESEGVRLDSTWKLRIFSLSHACDKIKTSFSKLNLIWTHGLCCRNFFIFKTRLTLVSYSEVFKGNFDSICSPYTHWMCLPSMQMPSLWFRVRVGFTNPTSSFTTHVKLMYVQSRYYMWFLACKKFSLNAKLLFLCRTKMQKSKPLPLTFKVSGKWFIFR